MKLSEALRLQYKTPCIVAFIGAGGKTTCMFRLAEELKQQEKKVLVTTTTKIYYPEAWQYDRIILHPDAAGLLTQVAATPPGSVTVAAQELQEGIGKLKGFSSETVDMLSRSGFIDHILIEADGAKGKPVKSPGFHEPVLPTKTDILLGLTGFDCYEKRIGTDTVHRINEFCQVTGKSEGETIDQEALLSLVTSEAGLFKTAPAEAQRIWVLNKVDDQERLAVAEKVGRHIFARASRLDAVMITALKQDDPVKALFSDPGREH